MATGDLVPALHCWVPGSASATLLVGVGICFAINPKLAKIAYLPFNRIAGPVLIAMGSRAP